MGNNQEIEIGKKVLTKRVTSKIMEILEDNNYLPAYLDKDENRGVWIWCYNVPNDASEEFKQIIESYSLITKIKQWICRDIPNIHPNNLKKPSQINVKRKYPYIGEKVYIIDPRKYCLVPSNVAKYSFGATTGYIKFDYETKSTNTAIFGEESIDSLTSLSEIIKKEIELPNNLQFVRERPMMAQFRGYHEGPAFFT